MPQPWEQHLNWIVPCRRAVVTSQVNYRVAMDAWRQCLGHEPYKQKMIAWYNVEDVLYDEELHRLGQWPTVFDYDEEHPVALEARITYTSTDENPIHDTVDAASGFYYVRLWKGPLRVLQASQTARRPINLNERKEVVDPEGQTDFVAGDVLEFPLFKFLRLCGREDLADLNFNGEGSYLLGTSLEEAGRAPSSDHQLHDNLMGMKFQLLLDLAVGIYYSTGAPLGVGFSSSPDGTAIASRSMIYGGSFANPMARHLRQRAGDDDVWAICTNGWGCGTTAGPPPAELPDPLPSAEDWPWGLGHAQNIPGPRSLNRLQDSHMLTSAWACSPSTIFLTHYLFEVRSPYGANGVATVVDGRQNDLHSHFVKRYGVRGGPAAPADPRAVVAGADVTVLSRASHEEAIVRLFPAAKLMNSEQMPRQGYLTGYNPLDGAAYVEESAANTTSGQLYTFEATGPLGRWRYVNSRLEYSVFGVQRFHFEQVGPTDDVFPDDLDRLYTTTDDAITNATSATRNMKPLVVFDKDGGLVVSSWSDLYAERAVPLPTMNEASGKFMTKAGVQALIQAAREKVQHPPVHPTPGGSDPSQSYRDLLA
ncbi:MAG: hypothetical protein PVJ57_04655 [Phycisphaerae bacterium]|jgi:hypothetical protein